MQQHSQHQPQHGNGASFSEAEQQEVLQIKLALAEHEGSPRTQSRNSLASQLLEGRGGTDNVEPVPLVLIDEGAHKYVLIQASHPRSNEIFHFVRSLEGAEYHKDAAQPLLTKLMSGSWSSISILGGGRILLNSVENVILVYGFSYGFGKADHSITCGVIEREGRWSGWDVSWNDEGY